MASLIRIGFTYAKNAIFTNAIRTLSTTPQLNLKEIHVQKEGDTVVIEGLTVPSPQTDLLVKPRWLEYYGKAKCYMCALRLNVKHTDVLILSQFVRSDGCMLPRRITGLCSRQQKKVGKMVTMAQKAGLMINLTPDHCKKDPKKRFGFKKFNSYFDEKTIFMKNPNPDPRERFKR